MSGTTTPRTGMPYPRPGQASAEGAFAEALNRMDALVPGAANSVGDTTPPGSPAEGDVYCLGASPTGAWSGQGGKVAIYVGGGWLFITPRTGWQVYAVDEGLDYRWSGSAWRPVVGVVSLQKTANQSISSATWTKITFDSEDLDNCGGHDNVTNNERITAPSWATECEGGLITTYDPQNSGAQGNISGIWKNGGTPTTAAAEAMGQVYQYFGNRNIAIPLPIRACAGGSDYWETWTFHDRGSATNLIGPATTGLPRTRFWMRFR